MKFKPNLVFAGTMKLIFSTILVTLWSFTTMLFCTTPHAYVAELGSQAISIIDTKRDTVQKIFGFFQPHVVRVALDGSAAYVGDGNNNIYKIHCNEHTVSIMGTLSNHPTAFCILPDASYMYAATRDGTLAIIDLRQEVVVKEIACLSGPQDIRATPDGQFVYVSNKGNGTISVIKTEDQTVAQVITGFSSPVGLMFDIDGVNLYVTDSVANCIYVIDVQSNSVVNTILGLNQPRFMAMSPKKTIAYISNGGNDSVSILRLSDQFIIGTIAIPNPSAIALALDGSLLYVASGTNELFKVDTQTNSIELVLPNFIYPSNIALTDNNAPSDTVNGWYVISDPQDPYIQISWSKPAGKPYRYRIFSDHRHQNLIATLSATAATRYLYNDLHKTRGQTYAYYVIADYPNGFSSTIGEITVNPARIGVARG